MNANWFLGLSIITSISILIAGIAYEPPRPPAPAIATPESGAAFAPFVFVDSSTGCEYLSTHLNSALTPRLAADGRTQRGCAAAAPEQK